MIKKIWEGFLEALFPRTCLMCNTLLNYGGDNILCQSCHDLYPFISNPHCKKCGKPIENKDRVYCYDCYRDDHHFDMGRALWSYEGAVKDAIHDLKYHNKPYKARALSKALATFYNDVFRYDIDYPIDLIIPVPLHKKRESERGYNQSTLMVKLLSKSLNIPYSDHIIKRTVNTKPLKQLTNKERCLHIVNAFTYSKSPSSCGIINKSILLIDDIYTTGTTVDEISRILKRNGAANVYVLCVSIGSGYS